MAFMTEINTMPNRSQTSLESIVIGLDGACHRVLEPLFEAGDLPHLESIFETGVAGSLESQIPP
jgi:predicted AlkP superfamily phosphohydrolase/phosphomutase